MTEPHISRIFIHPVKALDPVELDAVAIAPGGALASDRRWALAERDPATGDLRYVNGKRCPELLRLRTTFDSERQELALEEPGAPPQRFRLSDAGPAPNGVGEDTSFPLWGRVSWEVNKTFALDLYGGFLIGGNLRIDDSNGFELGESDYDGAPFAGLSLRVQY